MNAFQTYQSLVNEYQQSSQVVQRYRMYAFGLQAGIWILLFCLKYLQVHDIKLVAVILFGLFLASRFKNFSHRRNIDIRMTQATLEGIKLEQRNPRLGNFFHETLQQFGIIRIMILRVIFDFMAVYFFVQAAYHLAQDYNPSLALNIRTYYPAVGFLGFFLSELYYKPFQPLLKAKREVLSNR